MEENQNHNELNRALGRIEGTLRGMEEHLRVYAEKVDAHESFIVNLKGKIAIVSSAIALSTSLLTLWIKRHFFE